MFFVAAKSFKDQSCNLLIFLCNETNIDMIRVLPILCADSNWAIFSDDPIS